MTELEQGADDNCVRKVLHVKAPAEVAFRVFTEKMGSWWPLKTHKIGKAPAVDAVIEPRVGGRWFERGDDGSTCQWGRVLAWEPPSRLVLTWDLSATWQFDPDLGTEVEVRFIAESPTATRVEFEHRKLDRFGAARDQIRNALGGGWAGILDAFVLSAQG